MKKVLIGVVLLMSFAIAGCSNTNNLDKGQAVQGEQNEKVEEVS